jgi:hypothetical protein
LHWLKAIVAFIVVVSLLGVIFTGGQAQSAFEELFLMGFVFILVVEFIPQLIVGEEKTATRRLSFEARSCPSKKRITLLSYLVSGNPSGNA